MKEESESTIDVGQLLRDKSWDQLRAEEQAAAAEAFGNATEYDRVRVMMLDLRSESGIEEEELQPSKRVRENLLAAFDDEQRRRRVLWWNSLGFWLRDQLRFDIPAVRFAAAGIVLTVGILAVMQLTQNEVPQNPVADNEKTIPVVPEENNPKLEDNHEPEGMTSVPYMVYDYNPFQVYTPQIFVPVADTAGQEPVRIVDNGDQKLLASQDTFTPQPESFAMADSATSNAVPFVTNSNFACCNGASQTMNATVAGGASYSWIPANTNVNFSSPTNSNIGMTTVYVPNCRSLANDSKVIDAMFSMK